MSCRKWTDLLLDRWANELSEEEAILLEQHLADCEACRAEESRLTQGLAGVSCGTSYHPASDLARRTWERWKLENSLNRKPAEAPVAAAALREGPSRRRWIAAHGSPFELGSERTTNRLVAALFPFTRRIPVYFTAVAAALAILLGIWMGRRSVEVSQGVRSLPAGRPERLTPLEESRAPFAFATTPGDAITVPRGSPRDTL